MTQIPFRHIMAAHCESGTVTALLNHHGLNITEPMVFGIASGIFFAYFKTPMMDFPMFAVRSMPGQVRIKFANFSAFAGFLYFLVLNFTPVLFENLIRT